MMDDESSRDADVQEMDKSSADQKSTRETQRFVVEFIDLYQQYTCLWKYSCKDYRNRVVKERAYNALMDKMREIDPRADKNTVMKKINALRTAFRREFKKVRRAMVLAKQGKGPKKPYVPSLWYYEHLKFVVDKQDYTEPPPGAAIGDWDEHMDSFTRTDDDAKSVDNNEGIMDFLEDMPIQQSEIKIEPISPCSSRGGSPMIPTATSTSGPTLHLEIDSVYSEKQGTTSSSTNPTTGLQEPPPLAWKVRRQQSIPRLIDIDNADHERFGAYVAAKLKRSSRKQSIIAEKVIAEVLMRANLGTLEETTMLTDIEHPSGNGN